MYLPVRTTGSYLWHGLHSLNRSAVVQRNTTRQLRMAIRRTPPLSIVSTSKACSARVFPLREEEHFLLCSFHTYLSKRHVEAHRHVPETPDLGRSLAIHPWRWDEPS
jgi:hypothetical protein